MKEPEDEAFEDLAKRQGDWGLQGSRKHQIMREVQMLGQEIEQEPVANDPLPRACNLAGVDYQTFLKIKAYMPVNPPQRTEQNFCSRCGKRTPDLITIHTCTPPKENT
jgi:hypothetical protein